MSHEFSETRYDNMVYRRSGKSGLKLPIISLGLFQSLGEAGNDDECRRCMYYAFDHGITHFDLANNYGPPPGNAEIVAGKILKDMPRDEIIVSSKAGYDMWTGPYGEWGSKKHLVASMDQTLKRLQVDYVDIFYHHRPDNDTPIEETLATLDLFVKQGKALYVGVSNYNGTQYNSAVNAIKQHDWAPLTITQPYYNMLGTWIEHDLLPHTQNNGTGVIVFGIMAGGVISERYLNGLPADSRQGKRGADGEAWWNEQKEKGVWDRLGRLNKIAESRGQTLAQMTLAWSVRLPSITSALIGASKVDQIKANIDALKNIEFTTAELDEIAALTKNWP